MKQALHMDFCVNFGKTPQNELPLVMIYMAPRLTCLWKIHSMEIDSDFKKKHVQGFVTFIEEAHRVTNLG